MNVPDYTAPIVGYRGWCIHPEADRLMSGISEEVWHPGRAMKARCPLRLSGIVHSSPQEGCTCGIYALKSLLVRNRFPICGEVYLWGKLIEHRDGWRAQYAYPKSLTLQSFDPKTLTLVQQWEQQCKPPYTAIQIKARNLIQRFQSTLRRQLPLLALIEYGVEIRAHDGTLLWRPSMPKPSCNDDH
jgi:hypothetical protein